MKIPQQKTGKVWSFRVFKSIRNSELCIKHLWKWASQWSPHQVLWSKQQSLDKLKVKSSTFTGQMYQSLSTFLYLEDKEHLEEPIAICLQKIKQSEYQQAGSKDLNKPVCATGKRTPTYWLLVYSKSITHAWKKKATFVFLADLLFSLKHFPNSLQTQIPHPGTLPSLPSIWIIHSLSFTPWRIFTLYPFLTMRSSAYGEMLTAKGQPGK